MKTDVLVLGAGLAGLRAAWGALNAAPDLSVHIVSLGHGPSGSSFTNRNNQLGMRVPRTAEEREDTLQRAMDIGSPGFIDQGLATLLYDEAWNRLQDLLDLGLDFRMDGDAPKLMPGCFKGPDTCAVFEDLADAFTKIRTHVVGLGARFISGHEVFGLVHDKGGVHGAWLGSLEDGRPLCVSAGSVVMALGGPAPLFTGNIAGPGTPGNAYALLREAGANLLNAGYLQCMWTEAESGEFRSPARLLAPGSVVRAADGTDVELNSQPMLAQAGSRRTHCPASYGLEDAALDLWLLEHADQCKSLEVRTPGGEFERIRLAAHAGNGGATIDGNGYTGVPGLFACGECATGMHGANRLGGSMVTATQVFGRRAGRGAALAAKKRQVMDEALFTRQCHAEINALPAQDWDDFEVFEEIGDGLQAHALYLPGPGLDAFKDRLRELKATAVSRRVLLASRAALAVVG